MTCKLTAGVVVRHPGSGDVVFLPSGSDLPGWADGLLGGHVLDTQVEAEDTAAVEQERPSRRRSPKATPPRRAAES